MPHINLTNSESVTLSCDKCNIERLIINTLMKTIEVTYVRQFTDGDGNSVNKQYGKLVITNSPEGTENPQNDYDDVMNKMGSSTKKASYTLAKELLQRILDADDEITGTITTT